MLLTIYSPKAQKILSLKLAPRSHPRKFQPQLRSQLVPLAVMLASKFVFHFLLRTCSVSLTSEVFGIIDNGGVQQTSEVFPTTEEHDTSFK